MLAHAKLSVYKRDKKIMLTLYTFRTLNVVTIYSFQVIDTLKLLFLLSGSFLASHGLLRLEREAKDSGHVQVQSRACPAIVIKRASKLGINLPLLV